MPKITTMQTLLLGHAAVRENGSLFPLPEELTHPPTIRRSVAALVGRGWVKTRPTEDESAMAHVENNIRYGVFITPAGCDAVGTTHEIAVEAPARVTGRTTKAAKVLALLLRPQGATLSDLADATGWLPHTTRAALSGLRKKGHMLTRGKQEAGITCYRIVAA